MSLRFAPLALSVVAASAPACGGTTPHDDAHLDGGAGGDASDSGSTRQPMPPGPPPGPGPVDGVVLDATSYPAAGIRVQAGDAVTTTDANGRFHFDTQPASYDLVLATIAPTIFEFVQLTNRRPSIALGDYYDATAVRDGGIARVQIANVAGVSVMPVFSVGSPATGIQSVSGASGDYVVSWKGASAARLSVDLFGFDLDATTQSPTHVRGYQHIERDIVATAQGQTPVAIAPALGASPFPERKLTVSAAFPSGDKLVQTSAGIRLAWGPLRSPSQIFAWNLAAGPELSFVLPDVPGSLLNFMVGAASNDGATNVLVDAPASGAGDTVDVLIPASPSAIAPDDHASGVDTTTEFRWRRPAERIGFLQAFPNDLTGEPTFIIVTTAESARLPDTSKLGVTLPSGATYRWSAFAFDGVDSVDQAAASALVDVGGSKRTLYAYTSERDFTTR